MENWRLRAHSFVGSWNIAQGKQRDIPPPKINMALYLGLVRCLQTKTNKHTEQARCGVAVDCGMRVSRLLCLECTPSMHPCKQTQTQATVHREGIGRAYLDTSPACHHHQQTRMGQMDALYCLCALFVF